MNKNQKANIYIISKSNIKILNNLIKTTLVTMQLFIPPNFY